MTCILINEFRVTSYELISLRVAFIARVTVMSYFMIKNYSLRSFFDKELGACSFSCYQHLERPRQKLIFDNMISI